MQTNQKNYTIVYVTFVILRVFIISHFTILLAVTFMELRVMHYFLYNMVSLHDDVMTWKLFPHQRFCWYTEQSVESKKNAMHQTNPIHQTN